MSEAVIAASRFRLGARPGELSKIDNRHEEWLLYQLQGPSRLHEEKRDDPDSDVVKLYGRTVRGDYIDQTNAR